MSASEQSKPSSESFGSKILAHLIKVHQNSASDILLITNSASTEVSKAELRKRREISITRTTIRYYSTMDTRLIPTPHQCIEKHGEQEILTLLKCALEKVQNRTEKIRSAGASLSQLQIQPSYADERREMVREMRELR